MQKVKYSEVQISQITEELQKRNFILLYEENKAEVVQVIENKAVVVHIAEDN